MAEEEKEEFKYGVKKEVIEQRIAAYREIIARDLGDTNPMAALGVLNAQMQELIEKEEIADDDPERESKLAELKAQKEKIMEDVAKIQEENKELLRANDVLDELEDLLKSSKEELSFVEIEEIEKRIEKYKDMLSKLKMSELKERKAELESQLEKERKELEELKQKNARREAEKENDTSVEGVSQEFIDLEKNIKIKELRDGIEHERAMIAGGYDNPSRQARIDDYTKQLEDLEAGNLTPEIIAAARAAEIADIEEKIEHEKAMIAGGYENLARHKRLEDYQKRLEELNNPQAKKEQEEAEKAKDEERIAELEKSIAEKEKELKSIEEIENRNPVDIEAQRRTVENRIAELEELSKEKTLFKVNEQGDIEIRYPDVELEIDEDAISDEYAYRRTDMLDKYYGNREKSAEYKEKLANLEDHLVDKDFEFIDEHGKVQKGQYTTVEPYEGMEEDLKFLQLEEISKRLERLTRAEAGDPKAYEGCKDPAAEMEKDKHYIETNNDAYNRLASTHKNLMTLGKYGEKVPYSQMQQGQPARNILRAVGNISKFIRNHTTAPINKFIGSKIVAPIYGAVTGVKKGNVAGLYSNKRSHRYVARREYFASQGKGFFSSRFNAIFHAKEGNKAVLSAGAHDIRESIKIKYIDIAKKQARAKQIEFASKGIDDQIQMIKDDMEKTDDPKAKARFEQTLELLEKAKVQVETDRVESEKMTVRETRQTDAVDMDQHDKANKENVTRTVTGVKMLTRFGIRKFIGPKIEKWLLENTKKPETRIETYQEPQTTQQWVDATYKQQEVPITTESVDVSRESLGDIMESNAGKQVEGFYSVYGGERRPQMYTLSGDEKITSIFQAEGARGTGLADSSGLTAPTLVDRVFDQSFMDANGVLRQDVTLDKLFESVASGSLDPATLTGTYVSVGDNYWVKLSDLCEGVVKTTTTGSKLETVVDVPGHFETITQMVNKTREVTEMVENTRVTSVLDRLGIAYDIGEGALIADDIYENVRRTDTDVKKTKPQPRRFDYEAGYTGKKNEDYDADLEVIEIGKYKLKGKDILPKTEEGNNKSSKGPSKEDNEDER